MGTHGSLSKAGKARSRNPKKWKDRERTSKKGNKHYHIKKHLIPRKANRRRHKLRIEYGNRSGQRWVRK